MASSDTEIGKKRKIGALHDKLKTKLACDFLDERIDEGRSAKRFRLEARTYLVSEVDRAEKDPIDILDRLEARGHIAPGNYEALKEIVKPLDSKIVCYIKEKEEEINKTSTEDGRKAEIAVLSDVARNMHRSAELEILEHENDTTFVSVPFISQGLTILDDFGMLLIVGRSGSGKTKCALEILSSRKKNGIDLIFKLRNLDNWHDVVDPNKNTYIWLDDLFEKFSFEKSSFETMISTTKRGNVKVILTINDKANNAYQTEFSTMFKADMFLNLDKEGLSSERKLDILQSHLTNHGLYICPDDQYSKEKYESSEDVTKKYISQSEVELIVQSDPYLGFPLCCYLFSSNKENFRQAHAFFKNPTNKLIDAIDELRLSTDKSQVQQFCVLVYAAFRGGSVNPEEIDIDSVALILEIMKEENTEHYEVFVRKGIALLEKSYLFKAKKPEVFHSSIIKAAMVSFSAISIQAKKKVLESIDPLTFVEVVQSDEIDSSQNRCQVVVPHALYSDIAVIVRDRIQRNELPIMNCKLLENDQFVNTFLEKMTEPLGAHTFIHACKYNKTYVVQRMQQIKELKTSISNDTLTKGFEIGCLCGNREIVQSLISQIFLTPKVIIDILHPVRCNTALAKLLMDKLNISSLKQDRMNDLNKIVVRDECHELLTYFHQLYDCPNDILKYQGNLAGRRRSLPLAKWIIETFPSHKGHLIFEVLKGACVGGSRSLIQYLYEQYGDEVSKVSSECLRLACEMGNLGAVEEILYHGTHISKLEIGENLQLACFKGFSQIVEVLLSKTMFLSKSDILNGVSAAVKANHNGVLIVIKNFYDVSDEIISELREQFRQNSNLGPLSAMPFSPALYQNIPSVNISTPNIYNQKHRTQSDSNIFKKILSEEQLKIQMEKYKRCREIWNLCDDEKNAPQIRRLLQKAPELPYEILTESVQKAVRENCCSIIKVFTVFYPDKCENELGKMFLHACRDCNMDIVQFLLEENYIADTILKDAFYLCCKNEKDEILKHFMTRRCDCFHDEVIMEGIEKCCAGKHLNSLYHILRSSPNRFVNIKYRESYISLMLRFTDEAVLNILFSCIRFFPDSVQKGMYKGILLLASEKNKITLLNCFGKSPHFIDGATYIRVLKNLLKHKNYAVIKMIDIKPISSMQEDIFFKTLFSDVHLEQVISMVTESEHYIEDAMPFLVQHGENGIISQILANDISAVWKSKPKNLSMTCTLTECPADCSPTKCSKKWDSSITGLLPPLSNDVEEKVIKMCGETLSAHENSTVKVTNRYSEFLYLSQNYEFSTSTIERIFVNFCRSLNAEEFGKFWRAFNTEINVECLNNACCNYWLDVLPLLLDITNFPLDLIKLTEYPLYYILHSIIRTEFDSTFCNRLVETMYKNEYDTTDINEPLSASHDPRTIWRMLTDLFRDRITYEIIQKVVKMFCENSELKKYSKRFAIDCLNQTCVLSDSDIVDCCKILTKTKIKREQKKWEDRKGNYRLYWNEPFICVELLKDLPMSTCLEYAGFLIKEKHDLQDFIAHYARITSNSGNFERVCNRLVFLDQNHPSYWLRAMEIIDESTEDICE